jgi:PAT family acetyl-CoA transporter-like MFS transporter 1
MGYFMLVITTFVAVFKRETEPVSQNNVSDAYEALLPSPDNTDSVNDGELDASQLGLKETYHRLWEVCKLPAVKMLFLVLLTYRLPTALSDNVKFLKAVDFGLSKSTTALLSPTLILPLGIMVPIIANKIWHDRPLRQFMLAYRYRVTLIPLFDVLLLKILQHRQQHNSSLLFWTLLVLSTAAQATVNSLQFNAQMTFFAHRVDPAIGGSYMTLLNTAANLGGTWPSSVIMWTISRLSTDPICQLNEAGQEICKSGRDPYFVLQLIASVLGCVWVLVLGRTVQRLGALPDDAWRTHLLDETNADDDSKPTKNYDPEALQSVNVDLGGGGKGILASPNWIPRSQFSKEL